MNILYEGITNPISIYTKSYNLKDLVVSATGGCTLDPPSKEGQRYILKTNGSKRETRINVATKNRKGEHVSLASHVFRIRPLPILDAQLGGIKNDGKPKGINSVRAQTSIFTEAQNSFPYHLQSKVNSYKCTLYISGKDTTFITSSNKITEDLKWAMHMLHSGDFVAFTDIEYTITNSTDSTKNIAPPIFIPIR